MMNFRSFIFLLAISAGLILVACTKSTPIGGDLIPQDTAEVRTTSDTEISAATVAPEPLATYNLLNPDLAQQSLAYLLGDYTDPSFGTVKASINAQIGYPSPPGGGLFEDAILDSVVLVLRYDTLGFYGDTMQPQSVAVYQLDEVLDDDTEYFFDTDIAVQRKIGERNGFIPQPRDTVYLINDGDTSEIHAPGLRVRLDQSFGQYLIDLDTTVYNSTLNFLDEVKGIRVEATDQTNALMGFSLLSSVSRISLYYRQDTNSRVYSFIMSPFTFAKFNTFEHNYSDSIQLDDFSTGERLVYAQAMSGPNVKVRFDDLSDLSNIIVNKAELVFTVANPNNLDLDQFDPIRQFVAEYEDGGELVFIDDVFLNTNTSNFSLNPRGLGGVPVMVEDDNGNTAIQYTLNLSAHFQDIIDGEAPNEIILSAYRKAKFPNQTVIFGPGDDKYPMKLNLIYTQL